MGFSKLASTLSAALVGVEAHIVKVEANIGPGLPGTYIVGLADATIAEARDRMKTAANHTELSWPKTKVTVSLSPAHLRKHGAHFDLAMMTAILAAQSEELLVDVEQVLFLGEVSLKGEVLPVPGVLPALLEANKQHLEAAVIPMGNADEACLVSDLPVYLASNVKEVLAWMRGLCDLPQAGQLRGSGQSHLGTSKYADMADVVEQPEAIRAAEIAAAGAHHMFMTGPPGSGKSMIASRMPGIMPPLGTDEQLENLAVRSVMGHPQELGVPFVAPHHTISTAALFGGGSGTPKPGAISLAHNGVLFLDEVSEISSHTLDALRVPLDQGKVTMIRNHQHYDFPARFQLVLAANPCKCGAENVSECSCKSYSRQHYLRNVSGPLKDRLDLYVRTHGGKGRIINTHAETSAQIKARVAAARERMVRRFGMPNAHMDPHVLRRSYLGDEAGMALLQNALEEGMITQRGVDRALKVAWTICDLEGASKPGIDHIADALELREQN